METAKALSELMTARGFTLVHEVGRVIDFLFLLSIHTSNIKYGYAQTFLCFFMI